MDKLDGKTMDLVQQNINKLKKLFPEAVTEAKIDFDRLRLLLGDEVDSGKEKYEFTWPGKSECIRLSQQQSTGTLRPDKESSKDWDTTQNLYIEGDNLEVLRLLQKSYHRKVKMIYIDPPYNRGNDFIYKDDYRDNVRNYLNLTKQTMKANPETSGRYHSDWLNMMYPRLRLAKNLLRDDGVIFVSIDENENTNLKRIMNDVFGEENIISEIVWRKRKGGGNDSTFFAIDHEYILVYAKNKTTQLEKWRISYDSDYIKRYKEEDDKGKFYWDTLSRPGLKNPIVYSITCPDGSELLGEWQVSQSEFLVGLSDGEIRIIKNKKGEWTVHHKVRLPDGRVLRSIIEDYTNSDGGDDLVELFGRKKLFQNPKPVGLIKLIVSLMDDPTGLYMDFFSGSGTTAQAIIQANVEDEGKRHFIMVQFPENLDEKLKTADSSSKIIIQNAISFLNGLDKKHYLTELGKERIRRAGKKIKDENKDKEGIENLDIGFKVIKLDTSNLKAWDPDVEELEATLKGMVDPIKEDRTQEDMLYEIMLKYGIDLTMPLEEIQIKGKTAYSVGLDYMIVCLEDGLTLDFIEAIGAMKQSGQEIARVVFRDSGFADDNVKTNAVQLLKKFGIEDFRTI